MEHIYEWKSTKTHKYEKENDGPNNHFVFDVETNIKHVLKPIPGTGNITLSTSLAMKSKLNLSSFLPGSFVGADVDSVIDTTSVTHIQFHSVKDTGHLSVDVRCDEPDIQTKSKTSGTSTLPLVGGLLNKIVDLGDKEAFHKAVGDLMKAVVISTQDTRSIQDALNGQGRFVLPGARTFDMKDPIFNNAGDLMVGLTIKQGNSA